MSNTDETPPNPSEGKVKRRRHRAGLGTIFSLVVAGIVFFILFISLSGRTVPLPEFMRTTIEDRVNARYDGDPLSLGSMRFGVGRDGVPLVVLDDIQIADPSGGGVAYLNRLGANLSLDRLLRGEVAASNLLLAGAQITVRRTADGSFAFRSDLATETEAETLPELMERIDQFMGRSAMSTLTEVFAGGIVLTLEDARSGRIWQATNATAVLRKSDDALSLSVTSDVFNGTDDLARLQLSMSRSRVSGRVTMGAQVTDMPAADIALQSPIVSWLSVLDAPISGSVRTELDDDGNLASFAGTLDIAQGALKPDPTVPPAEFDAAQAYFTFDPARQRIDFSQITFASASGELEARGHAYLAELNGPWPSAFLGQFRAERLAYNGEDMFPAPVEFNDVRADLRLRLDPFAAEIAQLVIDNEGVPVTAKGKVEVRDGGWHATIDATSDRMAARRVIDLWPLEVSPISRGWIDRNVIEGQLYQPAASVRVQPGQKPDIALSFEIDEGRTTFLPDMPVLEKVKARVTMANHGFTLAVKEGGVFSKDGDWVDAAGSVFQVDDVRLKPVWAKIEVAAKAPLAAALTVLNNAPLRVLDRAGRSADIAEADAEARAIVRLPLVEEIPDDDVSYDVTARLTNVRSETLVEDRVFASDLLRLTASQDGIGVDGTARLDGVPLTAAWRQSFGEDAREGGRITGNVQISADTLTAFGVSLPNGLVGGRTTAQYDLSLPNEGEAALSLRSDLTGLSLSVPSINFAKPASASGNLAVDVTLGDIPDVRDFSVATRGLRLAGDLDFSDAGFRGASFSEVEINDWLDAEVELRPEGSDPQIRITGGTFDLRRFESGGSGGAGGRSGAIEINLDRLIVSDSITLSPIQGRIRQQDGGLQGTFQARVNGGAPIQGTLSPARGGTAIRIQAREASGVLRDAGLTPNAREGNLDVILTPVAGAQAGTYDGQFLIESIRMRKAPVMADLLDAISVVGLLDQLDGPGIHFTTIDGRFRLTPSRLQILEAAAVGPSMGISADGIYDFNRKALDVRGVVSPVYFLNGIGSIFTRRGEGLFGFNYRVVGRADNPRTRVNPLSILTPGMFRRIFRAAPPEG